MAPNITIYCLEDITDYFAFERLCHDLMARKGYSNIEPLGGSKDKGRDALHRSSTGTATVFAYSVREDWRAKLAEDAAKVHKHGHDCDELVFLSTAKFTAGERDEAVSYIASQYGWRLELYGVERLRILLEVEFPDVRVLHSELFPPHFYAVPVSSTRVAPKKEHLYICAAPSDAVFADWLTKKLTAEGYKVWYEGISLLGGESYPDDVDTAIREQAACVLGVYSQASLIDPEVMRQRGLALSLARERKSDFLVPLNIDGVQPHNLDRVTAALTFVPFQANWAQGLKQLLQKLEAISVPKSLVAGRTIAASTFLEDDVLSEQTERIVSNCLTVEHIPPLILQFEADRELTHQELLDLRLVWAFRKTAPKEFLSLHEPASSILTKYGLRFMESREWVGKGGVFGLRLHDLLVELIRKALAVKCHEKGLVFCPDTGLYYFPTGLIPDDRLKFLRPDDTKTFVQTSGRRKYWRPTGSEYYRYYLAPEFTVIQWPFEDYTVLVRVRIRITDDSGRTFPKRTGNSRRKHLCSDWWNHEWLNRMLAMCQFLASDRGKINIGDCLEEELVISATPVTMTAPFSINEQALDELSFNRSEELLRQDDDEEETQGEEGAQ